MISVVKIQSRNSILSNQFPVIQNLTWTYTKIMFNTSKKYRCEASEVGEIKRQGSRVEGCELYILFSYFRLI